MLNTPGVLLLLNPGKCQRQDLHSAMASDRAATRWDTGDSCPPKEESPCQPMKSAENILVHFQKKKTGWWYTYPSEK